MEYTLEERFLDYTDAIMGFFIYPTQLLDQKTSDQNDKSLINLLKFLIPSLSFALLFSAGFLLYFVFLFLISYFKKLKRPQFKTLSFAYLLFLFFMCELFNGNLNTSNIIVKVNDLLYSKQQILETQKEFCFIGMYFCNLKHF